MKLYKFLFFFITILTLFTNSGKVISLISQNKFSVNIVKQLAHSEGISNVNYPANNNDSCHIMWLKALTNKSNHPNDKKSFIFKKLTSIIIE